MTLDFYDIRFRQKVKLKPLTRLSVVDVQLHQMALPNKAVFPPLAAVPNRTFGSIPRHFPMIDLL